MWCLFECFSSDATVKSPLDERRCVKSRKARGLKAPASLLCSGERHSRRKRDCALDSMHYKIDC